MSEELIFTLEVLVILLLSFTFRLYFTRVLARKRNLSNAIVLNVNIGIPKLMVQFLDIALEKKNGLSP